MATVNSLVCWGGLTGKVVTLSIANPCVVTSTKHGVRDGLGLVFSTSGALPTGVVAGVTYYAKKIDVDTFNLYDTKAHAVSGGATGRVATTGSQSGIQTAKSDLIINPATRLAAYGLSDLTRWGSRIYDGISSWNAARTSAPASSLDVEICELGEDFIDSQSDTIYLSVPSAAIRIETKVNEIRSEGFHVGVVAAGYCLHSPIGSIDQLYVNRPNVTTDGFTLTCIPGWYSVYHIRCQQYSPTIKNMVVIGGGGQYSPNTYGYGIRFDDGASLATCINNVVVGCYRGISLTGYHVGALVANNTATNNGVGMHSDSSMSGRYYNNLSVGNTSNYSAISGPGVATNNAGLAGEAWMFGTGSSRLTVATTDFYGYASTPINLRAASVGSPQVDAGVAYYGSLTYDVADALTPNYNNGGSVAYDIGAYEFDHGYGLPPATCTLTLTNVVVGSRINIRDQAGTTTHYDALAASSTVVVPITVYGSSLDNWRIRVRKASGSPNYIPYETLMTAIAGATSIYVSQIPDE